MRFALTTALKDIRRRLADPAALLIWLGLPIVFGVLMNAVSGGSNGPTPKAKLLIADLDQTTVSGLVAAAGRQGPLAQSLEIESVTTSDGEQRMAAGKATALLIIPKGFQDGILNEQPTQLTLVTNPAERILPRVIEEGLQMAVEAAFYLQRVFGEPLRGIQATASSPGRPTNDQVAAISRLINQRLTDLQTTLVPPAITIETKSETKTFTTADFGALFMPGLVLMSLLFIAQGSSSDLWIEKEHGTLRRAISTPQTMESFLGGKILAGAALVGVVGLVALGIGMAVFKVPFARTPLALAWTCLAGAALYCYFICLVSFASSQRGGNLLSMLIVFPVMMIGGSFFPSEFMPPWMAAIGRWTPNGIAATQLHDILFGEPRAMTLVLMALAIAVPAAAAFFLSARRIERRFVVA
jgi:ABC-type multidrug transport system permease subunit